VLISGDWLLTPERVAIHRPTATAVIADLHLGYDQARQKSGEAVPVTPLDYHLAGLRRLASRYPIQGVVFAGDLCEDGRGSDAILPLLATWLRGAGLVLLAIVPGNHDRAPANPHESGFQLGAWRIVHGDQPLPPGPVVHGHFHPCLRWDGLTAPCYLINPHRLVLPAFSRDAAGVNVLAGCRWESFACCVIVGNQVLDFGTVKALQAKRKPMRARKRGDG